jgi:hypothetical protein
VGREVEGINLSWSFYVLTYFGAYYTIVEKLQERIAEREAAAKQAAKLEARVVTLEGMMKGLIWIYLVLARTWPQSFPSCLSGSCSLAFAQGSGKQQFLSH